MPFINNYTNPDFTIHFAKEFQENGVSYIYAVGHIKTDPVIIKIRKNGTTVWQKSLLTGKQNLSFYKILQLHSAKGYQYIITAYDGRQLYILSVEQSGDCNWYKNIVTQDEDIHCFLEPIVGRNGFYVAYSDKNDEDKLKNPIVVKFNDRGIILEQVVLRSLVANNGFVINTAKSHKWGLVLAGRIIKTDSVGIIIDLREDFKTYEAKLIAKPSITIQDIDVNGDTDYTISAYCKEADAIIVSHIGTEFTAPYYVFPNTQNHASVLAKSEKLLYMSIYSRENGTVHALSSKFSVLWSKKLIHNGHDLGVKTLEFDTDSNCLTSTTWNESLLVHTTDAFESCLTKAITSTRLINDKLIIEHIRLQIQKTRIAITNSKFSSKELKSEFEVVCGDNDPCIKDKRLCALHEQLQATYEKCFAKLTPRNFSEGVAGAKIMLDLILQFNESHQHYRLDTVLSKGIKTIKKFLNKPDVKTYTDAMHTFLEVLSYLFELGDCGCEKEELTISESAMMQSPHLYLQSAGSLGNDSTKGVHLRWLLKGGLSRHLPKADYAVSGVNFNKQDDFVRIYRAPYQELKISLDLTLTPNLVHDTKSTWIYNSGGEVFYIYFRNTARYTQVRTVFNPATNPVGFLKSYGDQLIEIEHKTKLSFAVTLYFTAISSPANIDLELLSTEKITLTAPRRVTLRKRYSLANLSGVKQLSENIRSIRLRATSAIIAKIEFEFYVDFISKAKHDNSWNFIGKHALTKDTAVAFNRLEPQPGLVHGKWLRFNDNAFVNINNYKAKWNSPAVEPENRILTTVEKYISLSNNAANPDATELIYFNDPNTAPIPGFEPDLDFNPSQNQFELSNLYILQLAAMDYHIACMLGLGILDVNPSVFNGKFLYLAEYVSFGDLQDGGGARRVQHFYCSLPTGLSDERLPISIDLKVPVPGIFQGLGIESPTLITDSNGYSLDGKTRFLSLFNEDLPDEPENASFFHTNVEFISAQATIPVYAGIEYRSSGAAMWQKPELPFVRNYLNIDSTVTSDKTNETRPVVLPESGYPVFVHREKQNGWHDYSSYGINWFNRSTASPIIHTIETVIAPTNLLLPPTNINAVLIRKESPLLLSSPGEQVAYNAITTTDKTFIRLTFDYNHGQELIDYHKKINGELISGYAELPDSQELFAENIEIFFRNEVPNSVSGKIVHVADDSNPLLSVVTTGEYILQSQGTVQNNTITPLIPSGMENNFIGSVLTVNGASFIVHQINNFGQFPKFTVFKNDANGFPVALSTSIAPGELTGPPSGGLFIVIENMLSPASWNTPQPLTFKVTVDLDTVYNETIEVHIPDGTIETHVQKFRGLYENALVEKFLEDDNGDEADGINPSDTPRVHLGLYKITFSGISLPQHSQAGGSPHSVEWYKGIIRVHTDGHPNNPRKELQVIRTENIGTTNDLIVYGSDGSFEAGNPAYDQVSIGVQKVNYYPGYKMYLKEDSVNGLTETSILPGPNEDIRYSIFGLRSQDNGYGFVSKISHPVLLYAQKIEEPLPPRKPEGGLYATRPDFFGKASYTFTTKFDHKPYAVQFGRASDIQILTAFWRNDKPTDLTIWTVKRIQEEIFESGNELWYNERWESLLGFIYTNSPNLANYGNFEVFPNDETGISLPLPNNPKFIEAIKNFITQHNLEYQTNILPITTIASLNQVIIPAIGQNSELKVIDFIKDVVYNCFVPLTEIPVVYQHIKGLAYSPIPKKQVIRDERGDLLKANDPAFDMAPMMKIIGPNSASVPVKIDHEIQFTDFGIDGASNAKYFYIAREFNLQMKTGPYSQIIGPINLVNTAPPKAPEIVKVIPVLENRTFGVAPAIELKINAYSINQNIHKITIYRATSMVDALSVRTMKRLQPIDIIAQNITGDVWTVRDDFSDLGYVPFGDPLFYVVTVSREVKYMDRDQQLVTEYQPSEPSKLTVTNIVENYNPEAPTLTYTPSSLNLQNELESVSLSWNKTVYNGKYHLYKRNEKGVWVKISELQSNDMVVTQELLYSDLGSGTLSKKDSDGNTIYHVFKVVAQNFAGMMSREEKILSI